MARSPRTGASRGGLVGSPLGAPGARRARALGARKADAGQVTPLALVRPSSNQVGRPELGTQGHEPGAPSGEGPPFDDAGVAAAKRGDPAAWEAAYRAYGRALMGYLMVRLDNREDAAEALSETFTRAISKASTLRGDAYAFRAWLFTIARHVSVDEQRGRARLRMVSEQPDLEDRSQPSGEEVVILSEDVAQLRKSFARLPKADQEVLWLRVCSGLSAAEVGEVVGKRPGAVRMQQMRALDALRSEVRL